MSRKVSTYNTFNLMAVLAVAVLILAACAPAVTPAPAAIPNPPAPLPAEANATTAPQTMAEPTINVAADPSLGNILVDGKGMTLYI